LTSLAAVCFSRTWLHGVI